MMKKLRNLLLSAALIGLSNSAAFATEVQIQTVLGNINVALFDEQTPETVDNFLLYVNSGTYVNSIFHRSVPGFVVQGGGFTANSIERPLAIETNPAVQNEPRFSNVRGTIAMAKLDGDPNSATSQWFINLDNNSISLDANNGGFTVFGQVLGDGMAVVDAIANLPILQNGGVFNEIPVRDYTQADANAGRQPDNENYIIVTDIIIVNDAEDSNPEVNPVVNTRINPPSTPPSNGGDSGGSSGGGSVPFWGLFALFSIAYFRRLSK
nr:peptidylprolyl isomerase [Agaribacter marinus]